MWPASPSCAIHLWKTTVFAVYFLQFFFCSRQLFCAPLQVYSFSRDGALPLSRFWYHVNRRTGSPVRAIVLCVVISFLVGVPGLANDTVLGALFSLTATGLCWGLQAASAADIVRHMDRYYICMYLSIRQIYDRWKNAGCSEGSILPDCM